MKIVLLLVAAFLTANALNIKDKSDNILSVDTPAGCTPQCHHGTVGPCQHPDAANDMCRPFILGTTTCPTGLIHCGNLTTAVVVVPDMGDKSDCERHCYPGTSGPCQSLANAVCFSYNGQGRCPIGTAECPEISRSPSASFVPPTPSSSPDWSVCDPTCFPGTSGPCQHKIASDTRCFPKSNGVCHFDMIDCTDAIYPSPTPSASPASVQYPLSPPLDQFFLWANMDVPECNSGHFFSVTGAEECGTKCLNTSSCVYFEYHHAPTFATPKCNWAGDGMFASSGCAAPADFVSYADIDAYVLKSKLCNPCGSGSGPCEVASVADDSCAEYTNGTTTCPFPLLDCTGLQ
jgi:hypothetical protein